ncbi:MAG: tetratricopeptide repeat protein [Bacteroidota bacterium]
MKIFTKTFLFFVCILVVACGPKKNGNDKTNTADSLHVDLATLNKKITNHPDDAKLYDQRAIWYLQNKDPDKALADINHAILLEPKNSAFYRSLSDVYFATGKIKNAQSSLEKASEINPKDAEAVLKLAELFFYMKDYKKTFEFTDKALKIDNLNAKADFIRGMALKDMGDTLKAVKSFEKAIEKDQQYFHAYMQLGLMYSVKHSALAIDYFNNALNLNPKSIEALYALAMFYQQNGDFNKAIAKYTIIIQIDPTYKYAYYNIGYIYLDKTKSYDDAIKYFTDAIKCDPNYAEAFYNRGLALELKGDIKNARADYQQALKIRTNYDKAIEGMNRLDKASHL